MPIAQTLKEVICLGDGYWHYFEMLDGTIKVVTTTKEDYDLLSQPSIQDGKWLYSIKGLAFQTPTGDISVGEYATIDANNSIALPTNGISQILPTTDITNQVVL